VSDGGASLTGACHCGAVAVEMRMSRDPGAIAVRECQCSFCRKHAARNVTDREGWLVVRARRDDLTRYQFAKRTCDFLLCRRCGVYVAAILGDDDAESRLVATVNTRVFADAFTQAAAPAEYGAESAAERRARRLANWTPAELQLTD
jgi:hypothetical protein